MFTDESEQTPIEVENLKLQIETLLGFSIDLVKEEDGDGYQFVLPEVGDKKNEIATMMASVESQLQGKYNFPCFLTLVINTQENSSREFN